MELRIATPYRRLNGKLCNYRAECILINVSWLPLHEAKMFASMVRRGTLTLDQARTDILMTDEQFQFLMQNRMGNPAVLRKHFEMRLETCNLMERILENA